ncbi:putative cell wall hydrolase [Lachnospiraceae bacterium KM106-2]|nr:putative cell wall hydrolase [Lachnospiraceae bacterium KM106-2]
MITKYLNIENTTEGFEKLVNEDLKFRTGKFVWRVKFNTALNPKSVNNNNVYVTTANQAPLNTNVSYNSQRQLIEIEPLEPYSENESYILHVTTRVQSKGGKYLKKEVSLQFHL